MNASHWFVSDATGDLHDTRRDNWASKPVRANYKRHHATIDTVADLKATLRAGEFAWPGGYRLALLTLDGAVLSFAAVRENLYNVIDSIASDDGSAGSDGWRVCAAFMVHDGEETVYCDHTGEALNTEEEV